MNRRRSLLFPQMNTALNLPVSASFQPIGESDSRAAKLKQLLLDLSKEEINQDFRSILRDAANKVREKAFGFNRSVTKRKIVGLIREFEICEMDDFLEEFKLPKKEVAAALDELEREAAIKTGKRRRWQEVGKHYNTTYELNE